MKKLTIVICTFNRSDLLENCFDSILKQSANSSEYDVLVINNNSSDKTSEIGLKFEKNHDNFRMILEPTPGLSNARNRGFKEASSEYISYVDDDAKLDHDYVKNALKIINDVNPDIFGGPIYPFYEGEKMPWVIDKYNSYSIYDKDNDYLVKGEFLSGSSFILKKELLEKYGGFNPLFGMVAGKTGYHEETALQLKAYEEGRKIYYSKSLIAYHLVPEIKQRIFYYIYANYKSGKDGLYLWSMEYSPSEVLNSLIKELDEFMIGFEQSEKNRDKERYPYPENYIIEELCTKLFNIGSKMEFFLNKQKVSNRDMIRDLIEHEPIAFTDLYGSFRMAGRKPKLKDIIKINLSYIKNKLK